MSALNVFILITFEYVSVSKRQLSDYKRIRHIYIAPGIIKQISVSKIKLKLLFYSYTNTNTIKRKKENTSNKLQHSSNEILIL